MPDAVDNLATWAIDATKKAGLTVPADWLASQCPEWADVE